MSVLVVARKLANRVPHSKVPQLDRVVSTARQESIVGVCITKSAFVKLNGVGVSLMTVIHRANRLIDARIVHDQFFVRSTNDTDRRRHFCIVEGKGWDMLRCGVRERL